MLLYYVILLLCYEIGMLKDYVTCYTAYEQNKTIHKNMTVTI